MGTVVLRSPMTLVAHDVRPPLYCKGCESSRRLIDLHLMFLTNKVLVVMHAGLRADYMYYSTC
jgi:hypothetical protein